MNNIYDAYIVDEQYIILNKKFQKVVREGKRAKDLGVGAVREGPI